VKEASKMSKEEWKEYFSGHWNFGGTKQDGHIAMRNLSTTFGHSLLKITVAVFCLPIPLLGD